MVRFGKCASLVFSVLTLIWGGTAVYAQGIGEDMACSAILNAIVTRSSSEQGDTTMVVRHPADANMISPLRARSDRPPKVIVGEPDSDGVLHCLGLSQKIADGTYRDLIVSADGFPNDTSGKFSVLFFSSNENDIDYYRNSVEEGSVVFGFDLPIREGLASGRLIASDLNLPDFQVRLFVINSRADEIAKVLPDTISPLHGQNGRLVMVVCPRFACPGELEAIFGVGGWQPSTNASDVSRPHQDVDEADGANDGTRPQVSMIKQIRILGQRINGETPALPDELNTPRMLFCLLDAVLDSVALDARSACEGIDFFSEEKRTDFANGLIWLTENDEFVFTPAPLRADRLRRINATLPATATVFCNIEATYLSEEAKPQAVLGKLISVGDSSALQFELEPLPKFDGDSVPIVFSVSDEVECGTSTHEVTIAAFDPIVDYTMAGIEFDTTAAATIGLWNLNAWENQVGTWDGFQGGDVLRVMNQGLEAAHLQRANAFTGRKSALSVSSIATLEAGNEGTLAMLTGSGLITNVKSPFEIARSPGKRRGLLQETSALSVSSLKDAIMPAVRQAGAANNRRLLISLVGFPLEQAPIDVCRDEILTAVAHIVAEAVPAEMDLRLVAIPFVRSEVPVSGLKPLTFNPNLGPQASEVFSCPESNALERASLSIYPFVPMAWRSQQDALTQYGSALGDVLAAELIAISRPMAR